MTAPASPADEGEAMTESEAEAWDVLSDTDALRCCSCPACNHYLPHDEAEAARLGVPKYDPDSTCEVRAAIERIVAARVAAADTTEASR